MSGQVTKPSRDVDAISGPSKRSSGMFDWMRGIAKPSAPISKSCVVLSKVPTDQMVGNIMENFNRPRLGKEKASTMMSEPKKNEDTLKKTSDLRSPDLSVSVDKENTSKLRNLNEDEVDQEKLSLGAEVGGPSSILRCNEKHVGSSSAPFESKALACLRADQINGPEGSGQFVAFEKQFSSDNFACIDKGKCKYKKFSTLLLLEKKTNNNTGHELQLNPSMANNFYPFFRRKENLCRRCLSTDKSLPCSVHNVETMRICTMVDSMETRSRGPPKISQRAHQFQFTKETCVNLSKDHHSSGEQTLTAHVKEKTVGEFVRSSPLIHASRPQEVRIEPLQTVSDSAETEMAGSPLISKPDASESSPVQNGTTQIDEVWNQIVASGSKSMTSSPSKKDNAMDESIGPSTEKARSKRPIIGIPDMSKEIPTFQPEGSSTDSEEVSTSRVHSLNAKHLFPVGEHPSNSEFSPVQDPSRVNNGHDSRWIKRLRVSSSNDYCVGTKSSDIAEPSAHKKCGELHNKIMKTSNIAIADATDQNTDSPKKSEGPLNFPEDGINYVEYSCPWVQRWRKDPNFASNPSLKKTDPAVICEPHSLQFGVGELGKRQFPSIGAMALMGKTMNGFRSCEIKKKGSVFVWNTKEY